MKTKNKKNYILSKDLMSNTSKNRFFFKSVLIWNRLHDDKINFKNNLTYRKTKTTFKDYYLLFEEDPTVVTYGKISWRYFKFL